jgi:hypothetical protein
VVGNASGDWDQKVDSNRLWLGGLTVSGFNAGIYVPSHPQELRPAVEDSDIQMHKHDCVPFWSYNAPNGTRSLSASARVT